MICPTCEGKDIELEYEDASFDHAFGTEIVRFYYCPECDYQIDAGEVEEDE